MDKTFLRLKENREYIIELIIAALFGVAFGLCLGFIATIAMYGI
ncbi:hypothetical protein [Flagellimonas eckloniae]|nr:hypothetical protein [Allomuricauda eckloniae]